MISVSLGVFRLKIMERTDMATVFTRNWWRWENSPSGRRQRVPAPKARKTVLATGLTVEEARRMCAAYNESHDPGPLSKKAEFTS